MGETSSRTPIEAESSSIQQREMYLRIYGGLKEEIGVAVKDSSDTERNILLLCGAMWTYLAGKCTLPNIVWYLPTVLAVFGAARTTALMISIKPRGMYLHAVERLVLKNGPLEGWEAYLKTHYRRGVAITMILFWAGLIAASMVIPRYASGLCHASPLWPPAR